MRLHAWRLLSCQLQIAAEQSLLSLRFVPREDRLQSFQDAQVFQVAQTSQRYFRQQETYHLQGKRGKRHLSWDSLTGLGV